MTYATILADIYRKLGFPASPATATTTRLAAMLNETLQEVIAEPGIAEYVEQNIPPFTFASVANQSQYGLNVPRILSMSERTNRMTLGMRTRAWYRDYESDPTTMTGTPTYWIPLGYIAVAIQPSNASEIFVKSTSASDGAGVTAFIEGIRTGGYFKALSVAMNGVTAVSLSAAFTDFVQITKFYVSAAAVGTITLVEDSGVGTVLATIPIGQTFSRYFGIALWPTPAAAITYYVDADRDLPDMSNANDEPPFPVRFHRVLVDGTIWRELVKTDDTRAAVYEKTYRRDLSRLKYFLTCPPDLILAKRSRPISRSRFGGYFPSTDY